MTTTIKILGERNSGTNFFELFLKQNFELNIAKNHGYLSARDRNYLEKAEPRREFKSQLREALRDNAHFRSVPNTGGWKHAAPTQRFLDEFATPRKALVLCLVRHPAVWLQSMHRNPFHALSYVSPNFSEFIRTPWACRPRDELINPFTASPLHMYLDKFAAYKWLAERHAQTMILRYEDILLAPQDAANRLTSFIPRLDGTLALPSKSARNFGVGHNNLQEYHEKARASSYDLLSKEDRDFVQEILLATELAKLYPL
jgi:hypothetical protein